MSIPEAREAELMQKIGELEAQAQAQPIIKTSSLAVIIVIADMETENFLMPNLPPGFDVRAKMAKILRMASAKILESLK